MPRGVEDLVERLGFSQVHGLSWWEQIEVQGLKITMTPCKHWGARMFRDTHRGYGGYVVEGGGQSVYHSGDTAYFDGFREIGATSEAGGRPTAHRSLFSRQLSIRAHQPGRGRTRLR